MSLKVKETESDRESFGDDHRENDENVSSVLIFMITIQESQTWILNISLRYVAILGVVHAGFSQASSQFIFIFMFVVFYRIVRLTVLRTILIRWLLSEIPASSDQETSDQFAPVIRMFVSVLLFWQGVYRVDDNAMVALFKLLKILLLTSSKLMNILKPIAVFTSCIPISLAGC